LSYWQLLPTIVPALADDTQPLEHVAIRQSVRPGKNMATADGCADCPGIEHCTVFDVPRYCTALHERTVTVLDDVVVEEPGDAGVVPPQPETPRIVANIAEQ